jgi:hypothetical protein
MTFIVPIIALLLLGIYDFSRVFTSMMAVESAAREAADYGAWQSRNWDEAAVVATVAGMEARACVASRNLPNYQADPDDPDGCLNPSISISLIDEKDAPSFNEETLQVTSDCNSATRTLGGSDKDLGPCDVRVDLTYTFDLIVPFGFEAFGTRFGLPQDLTFTRSSVFAISDFTIDQGDPDAT